MIRDIMDSNIGTINKFNKFIRNINNKLSLSLKLSGQIEKNINKTYNTTENITNNITNNYNFTLDVESIVKQSISNTIKKIEGKIKATEKKVFGKVSINRHYKPNTSIGPIGNFASKVFNTGKTVVGVASNVFSKFNKVVAAAKTVFELGKKIWNAILLPAAKTQKAEKLIRYKSGSKQNEIVESIYKSAHHSTFALDDFMKAGESLAPKLSGSVNSGSNMEKVLAMSEKLAMVNSSDVSSAANAFKSALSGDFSALINSGISEDKINSAGLKQLANNGNVDGVIEGLEQVLTTLGYTDSFLSEMEDTTLGKVQIIQNSLSNLKSTFGKDLLAPIKPILDDVIQLLEGPVFQLFLKTLKESMAYIIPIVSVIMKILIIVGKFIMAIATVILHIVNFFADLIAKFGKWLGIGKKAKKMDDLAGKTGLNATNNADKHIKVVEEVGKINNDVNIADEDIKLMRDVAERDAIKNFVTLTPTVSFGSTTINENADANKLLGVITSALEKEIANSARGVYAV